MWSVSEWVGRLFQKGAQPRDYLRQYASVFTTVEGNTTFYSVPRPETVLRWRDETPEDFQFCFKLPKRITHELGLRDAQRETTAFLRTMAPAEGRLGPFMIQLSPNFGPRDFDALERFLALLPGGFRFSVELRHRDFFQSPWRERANELLARHGAERVIFDTRGLRRADPSDPQVALALAKKPDRPVHSIGLSQTPMVRFVAHPEVAENADLIDFWADQVAVWITQGRRPFFFLHSPGDAEVPALALAFHERLSRRLNLPPLPRFPCDFGQLSLIDDMSAG